MSHYRYVARDRDGKKHTGILSALDEKRLHEKLKEKKLYLVSARNLDVGRFRRTLRADKVSEFCRNMGNFLLSGVPLAKALQIIARDEASTPGERKVYTEVLKQVRLGNTLSSSMEEQGGAFPDLLVHMFETAEETGNLGQTARQMEMYYAKQYRLKRKISNALLYPRLLCIMLLFVISLILSFVIPRFSTLFAQMEQLPLPTRILLGVSDFVAQNWYLILLFLFVAGLAIKILFSIPSVKYGKDRTIVHIPFLNRLWKTVYTARFARTMSSLYAAGIPIVPSLQIARNTIGNSYIEKQFDRVIELVKAGNSLSNSVEQVDGFVNKLSTTILVGEESGKLDEMLHAIAEQLEYDSEMAINKWLALLEPFMIILMAVLVGFVMLSIIMPIDGSYQSISIQYD